MSLERHQYDRRERHGGQFIRSPSCDGCGKPVGTAYYTDDEVCGGTDDPGFYLCDRARCLKKREGLDIEARRLLYTSTRREADAARREVAKPKMHHECEVERAKEVRHFSLNLHTGEETAGHNEIRTEPCGTPLFSDEECRTGVCRFCLVGWTHPGNYATAKGLALIASVKEPRA